MNKQGQRTATFGKWLCKYFEGIPKYAKYKVYYDHGESTADPNVVATKGYRGTMVTNLTRLADIDVMIIGPDDEIQMLFEIEERPVVPKKLLGVIFAALLCNGFAVKVGNQQVHAKIVDNTTLVVAGVVPTSGNRLIKIEKTIKPLLCSFCGLKDGIKPTNVELTFTCDINITIRTLQALVEKRFPK